MTRDAEERPVGLPHLSIAPGLISKPPRRCFLRSQTEISDSLDPLPQDRGFRDIRSRRVRKPQRPSFLVVNQLLGSHTRDYIFCGDAVGNNVLVFFSCLNLEVSPIRRFTSDDHRRYILKQRSHFLLNKDVRSVKQVTVQIVRMLNRPFAPMIREGNRLHGTLGESNDDYVHMGLVVSRRIPYERTVCETDPPSRVE